jgi:glycosyltransferase involved in cell wall biosynthesis
MMTILEIAVVVYIACGSLYWLFQLYVILRVIRSVPLIENLTYDERQQWPKISIIIPACNEAQSIGSAIQTRLNDDYPNFEIVLIDDRSTDGTSEIIDKIASHDNRVRAIHIKELPDGWLGKLYAMHRGVQEARGEWFLFSDADVHVKKTTLKRVLSYAESRKLDHLAVFPKLLPTNLVLDSVLSIFIRDLCMWCRVWAIENKDSEAYTGSGSFNFVRRSAFEKTRGFDWLKLEVCDDVALGHMLKKSGAKSSLINGCKFVSVYFYHTVREMAIGAERATFTVFGNFSAVRLIAGALLSIFLELSPFVALFISGIPYVRYVGVVMVAIALIISIMTSMWTDRPIFPSLLLPMSVPLMNGIAIRAGLLGAIRKGIIWRGTFYPTDVLKRGKRLDFQFLFFK